MKKYFHFVDHIQVVFQAGSGGDPSSARRRFGSNWVNLGGNGGNGGDIYLEADRNVYDLSRLSGKKRISGEPGHPGAAHRKKGADASDTVIKVPVGTFVRDERGIVYADLDEDGRRYLIAHGGIGGKGNFKRTETTPPQPGESVDRILDFRLPVDVALIGPTNSGKTSFLSAITGKEFKVSEYPYSTWHPFWGAAEKDYHTFTVMELPAIVGKPVEVESALKYMRHLERVKILIYFLDALDDNIEGTAVEISHALEQNDKRWLDKQRIYVVNKSDMRRYDGTIDYDQVFNVSVATGQGMPDLLDRIVSQLETMKKSDTADEAEVTIQPFIPSDGDDEYEKLEE
jgi:GTP-binding protein